MQARSIAWIVLTLAACKAEGQTASPASAPEALPEDIATLEQRLDQTEAELTRLGAPPVAPELPVDDADAAGEASAAPPPPEAQGRRRRERAQSEGCRSLCGLRDSTCELMRHVCDLASRHADELRYTDACTRAEDQCIVATEACDRCSGD